MNEPEDPRPHYMVKMTNLPPDEVTCKCGTVFDGDNPLGDLKRHMQEENPSQE